ncbi:flavin reductase family protein [Roseovarius pacificus]|uniref:flavin reductase family protein n=1 Tax=Roseovarius pacificus TaxID=337701 RepID=UPI002A1872B1|nr:flavin reductase family protein [Roseovarius pacificus]
MSYMKTEADIDPGAFWRTLGERPIGATVITTAGENGPEGFLGLSFAHVSAAPPTVLVSVGKSTSALDAIRRTGSFAANIMPYDAEGVVRGFGGDKPVGERFADVTHSEFVTGAPVLDSARAVFDCRVLREIEEGDTVIFLARVAGVNIGASGRTLVAYRGGYSGL